MNAIKKVVPSPVAWAVLAGVVLGIGGFTIGSIMSGSDSSVTVISQGVPSIPKVVNRVASSTLSGSLVQTATTSIDTRNWATYTNYELGFSINYPRDLVVDAGSQQNTITFSFPSSYYTSVMSDAVRVSVAVSATCTPVRSYTDRGESDGDVVMINGIQFAQNLQYGIGAGTYDDIKIYDTNENGACYRIKYSSHGGNSAGAFTSDHAEMAVIDAARNHDRARISNTVDAMLQSFNFATTGAGVDEASYGNPANSGASSGVGIDLLTIAPTLLSTGGNAVLTGAGFSGHDTIVWISNGTVKGVVWGGMPTSDSSLSVTIPAKACTLYTGASGMACPSYLVIKSGLYTVFVSNQNGTTDPVYLTIQ